MNIKSDPEVVQRWYTHHWIGNFDADLSMMVSRPYEANLGRKKPPHKKSKFAKIFFVENLLRPGRDRIPARQGSQTGAQGGQERAKEGQIRAI